MPKQNKQLVINRFDADIRKASTITAVDIPIPKEGEVLIKNTFVGINAIYDRELYRGAVPYIDVRFPYVFGVEAVGRIVGLGSSVNNLKEGEAVSTVKVGSAYQEYQVISSSLATRIPDDSPEYLTINPTGISAHLALEKVGEIKQREVVVVSAAAGGLGHILVQLSKLAGCHVVAICGSDEKVGLLEDLKSCDRIINYRRESVSSVLSSEYNDKIDIAIDSVGQHMFDNFLANLAPKGRLVVCGLATELSADKFQSVRRPRVYESIYWKGASVRCFMNHLYKEDHPQSREILNSLYQDNRLSIKVDKSEFFGIESIVEASSYLLAGRSVGKVVVQL